MKRYESYKPSGISWIGEIPSHWEEKKAKYLFIRQNRMVNVEDDVITCFRDGQVTLRKNRRTTGFTESFKEYGYQGIRKGDLVIHQMDAFAGSTGISDSNGKGTPVYIVCTPANANVYNPFFGHVIRYMGLNGYIMSLYKGIRERSSNFSYDVFCQQYLPFPPLDEQKKIVEYLSTKTSLIDAQQSAREKEIRLLEELKQAEIANVVTRGLNPDVPLKDSGIPWIGKIPSHWETPFLFQFCNEHFISNKNVHHQNLLSLSYGKIIRKDINKTDGLLPKSFDTYQIVEPGNIILRLTDLQNDQKSLRVGLAKEEGIITSAYVALEVKDKALPEYLYLILHTYDIKKVFYSMGGGLRQSLNFDGLRKLNIPIPPLEEQRAIVEYIEQKNKAIGDMIANLRAEIDFLTEYKQRLIADAVTGQIKID